MTNKIDYAKVLFIGIVGTIISSIFGGIFSVSYWGKFSISPTATHKVLAMFWMFWVYIVPIALVGISVLITVVLIWEEFDPSK